MVAEGAARLARGAMRLAELFVKVAGWARRTAMEEECLRCRMGDMTARRSCAMRTGNTAKCGAWAGAGGDA